MRLRAAALALRVLEAARCRALRFADRRYSSTEPQLQRISEGSIQFFLFPIGKRSDKMREFLFHHESKEIASDRAVFRKPVITADKDLAA